MLNEPAQLTKPYRHNNMHVKMLMTLVTTVKETAGKLGIGPWNNLLGTDFVGVVATPSGGGGVTLLVEIL